MKRAVITGLGIVSSIGNNQQEVLASLQEGRSGITFAQEFKDAGMRSHVWGDVKLQSEPKDLIDRKVLRFMSDASIYAYLAMQEAIADSGLSDSQVSNFRSGLVVGSGGGSPRNQVAGSDAMRTPRGLKGVGPYMVTKPWHPVSPRVWQHRLKSKGLTTLSVPLVRLLLIVLAMLWS